MGRFLSAGWKTHFTGFFVMAIAVIGLCSIEYTEYRIMEYSAVCLKAILLLFDFFLHECLGASTFCLQWCMTKAKCGSSQWEPWKADASPKQFGQIPLIGHCLPLYFTSIHFDFVDKVA